MAEKLGEPGLWPNPQCPLLSEFCSLEKIPCEHREAQFGVLGVHTSSQVLERSTSFKQLPLAESQTWWRKVQWHRWGNPTLISVALR